MGGFLSIFAPPGAPEPAPPLPAPAPPEDADEAERKRRLDMLARRRRGRAETVATSFRGLLRLAADAPRRKSLLGE
jgi:hypothetical protein